MKNKRTTDDVEAHLVACYEWHPVSQLPPTDPTRLMCVSVPGPLGQTVATYDGKFFWSIAGAVLVGVTFWCWLPATPETMLAEAEAEASREVGEGNEGGIGSDKTVASCDDSRELNFDAALSPTQPR
jgi:hypothetical protein